MAAYAFSPRPAADASSTPDVSATVTCILQKEASRRVSARDARAPMPPRFAQTVSQASWAYALVRAASELIPTPGLGRSTPTPCQTLPGRSLRKLDRRVALRYE